MKFIKSLFFLAVAALSSSASAQVFYQISGNGLEAPSYIFGTHHLAPLSIIEKYNIPEYIDRTQQVVGEIDLTQDQMAIAMAMQPYMMAPADSTLSKILSPEDYEIANEAFKKFAPMPGIDLSMFEPLKPMVVETTVTAGIMSQLMPGFDPNSQLDTYFMTTGKETGKKIVGLETPDFQANLLFNFVPITAQAEDLLEMLKQPEKTVEMMQKLNEAYLAGDLEAMQALQDEEDVNSDFNNALLDKRNADWLTKLPSIMSEGPAFIAVGALHLAGDKGVITGLRNLGYTVEEITVEQPAMAQ